MKAIIIGAGRGSRLRPYTDDRPKCLVEVGGKPILSWILDAFHAVGLDEVVFIGGYRMDDIVRAHPALRYVRNDEWERNNILTSLFCAEEHMEGGFVCAYSDTIITAALLEPLMNATGAITMALDSSWNARHGARPVAYDAHVEATWVEGERVVRIGRVIPPGDALGEFTGVTKVSAAGATRLRAAYHEAHRRYAGRPFHHGKSFETAYLVDLLLELIAQGESIGYTASPSAYLEIDTVEDYELANREWVAALNHGGS